MNEEGEQPARTRSRPTWLPYAIVLGSPCFAGAMTVGMFAADARFVAADTFGDGVVKSAVVYGNAFLALLGASVGGALIPARPVRKARITAAAGVIGLSVYFVALAIAINLFGVMI